MYTQSDTNAHQRRRAEFNQNVDADRDGFASQVNMYIHHIHMYIVRIFIGASLSDPHTSKSLLLDCHFTNISDRKWTPNLQVLVWHESSL